jgi:hypothetical protein
LDSPALKELDGSIHGCLQPLALVPEEQKLPSKYGEKLEKFYHSAKWKRCREAFIAYKHGICDICGKRGYLVHHIIELDDSNVDDPNVSLSFSNLQLLCVKCHNVVHGDIDHGMKNKPTVCLFDNNGNVVIADKKKK